MKKTKQLEARKQNFENIKAELEAQGYQSEKNLIRIIWANVFSILLTLVFGTIMVVLFFIRHPIQIKANIYYQINFAFGSIFFFFLGMMLLIIIHEGIHGITWSFFCKRKWKSIQFGFLWKYVTPYCSCLEILPWKGYLLGGLMPTIILGIGFYIVALMSGNFVILMLSIVNVMSGAGDILVAIALCKRHDGYIMDLPEECGFMRFYKS